VGQTVVLAEVTLPPQYCGALQYFAQFTDQHARDPALIETDGIEWLLLADGGPLAPYLQLDRIINPWGAHAAPLAIRLQENTTIRLAARGVALRNPIDPANRLTRVGGRLLGRYWYNATYGDAGRKHY
jgi:hypothetical protein